MSVKEVGCKVNWTLEVLGRRFDGFHELRSWFIRLDLGDQLSCKVADPGSSSSLRLSGPYVDGVPSDSSNLVLQADSAWRKAGGIAQHQNWLLHKQLPPGSGLGAGSADAAGTLLQLQEIAQTPLDRLALQDVAEALGSDVPFFLSGKQAALMGGRGEQCLASSRAPQLYFVIAIPPVTCPTPLVYAQLRAPDYLPKDPCAAEGLPDNSLPDEAGENDLELAACRAVDELAEWGRRLRTLASFRLSGSGSAWYATSPKRELAEAITEQVRAWGLPAWVTQPKLST